MPEVSFSIKYENPEYPDEVFAVDWDWLVKKSWSISLLLDEERARWALSVHKINDLARLVILKKFGLDGWEHVFSEDLSVDGIGKISPAELIQMRRRIEIENNLGKLEVTTDNFHIVAGVGQVNHTAEEYT